MTAPPELRDNLTSQYSDHTILQQAVSFNPISSAALIPDEWITQVKAFKKSPEEVRQEIDGSIEYGGLLFGLFKNELCGFLWCQLEGFDNMLYVHAYSVDRELWHTRTHLNNLIKLLEWLKKVLKVDKVRWFTDRPGLYRKMGYKPAKLILMEA